MQESYDRLRSHKVLKDIDDDHIIEVSLILLKLLMETSFDETNDFLDLAFEKEDPLNYILFENPSLKKEQEKQRIGFYISLEKPKSVTGVVSCIYCKGTNVSVVQKQTRSADEPLTLFCTCNSCNKGWRQN